MLSVKLAKLLLRADYVDAKKDLMVCVVIQKKTLLSILSTATTQPLLATNVCVQVCSEEGKG